MSNSLCSIKPEFSVRIVVCDHYLTKPTPGVDVIYSEFRGSDIKQVPVLRVFGCTPDGRKTCLHVHGVFPYFYIPCPTPNPEPQFLYQIAVSLDKALNIALKQATSATQHVYKISLVKGLPFYGFHDKDHLYLKVFLYNPALIRQAVELCSNGAILGQTFQPHESHLNFTLQFFIDFNLFGMSSIDLQFVKFRRSGISQSSTEPLYYSEEGYLKPESICYYEADCSASHIMNRQKIGRGDGIENPGLEEVWQQEVERRKQLNMSMASKSLSQSRINTDETESHYKFKQQFQIKMSGVVDKPVDLNTETNKLLEQIHYPAESLEGSQLFNAVDVSIHLPDNTHERSRRYFNDTLNEDVDNTIVDENVAFNSSLSLHYSQVQLDNDDMELVDLLQDMDEKHVEENSVMGTPAAADNEEESESTNDLEYSQVFNENTLLLDPYTNKGDESENFPAWNDSFWDGANIPQLDGTCDDDHVKKVRKRKMRSFKIGLSRPQTKKQNRLELSGEIESLNESDVDEINASRETIDSISDLHLKRNVLKEIKSPQEDSLSDEMTNSPPAQNESIADLVMKMSVKLKNKHDVAQTYDIQRRYEPVPGPSNCFEKVEHLKFHSNANVNDSLESTPEDDNLGIMSFYNMSKVFDMSSSDNFKNDGIINKSEYKLSIENELTHSQNINQNKDVTHDFRESVIDSDETPVTLIPKFRPPSKKYVLSTLEKYNIPEHKNPVPHFSDHKDVGDKVEIGHMLLRLYSKSTQDQKPFEKVLDVTSIEDWRQLMFLQTNDTCENSTKPEALKSLLASRRHCILEPVKKAPTKTDVLKWTEQNNFSDIKSNNSNVKQNVIEISKNINDLENSQAIGLNEDEKNNSISLESYDKDKTNINITSLQVSMQTDGSFLCFGNSDISKESSIESPTIEVDFLTVMIVEIHAEVRGDLNPDPAIDAIQAMFLSVTNDCPPNYVLPRHMTEIIIVDNAEGGRKFLDRCIFNTKVKYVSNEAEMLESLILLVKKHDPDIMCGYEIEMNSWGYILERSQNLGLDMVKEISRITEKNRQKRFRGDENDFEGRIIGRIMFNVWRLFRHELALSSYSFENCMYEVLKERIPKYSNNQLAEWWNEDSRILRWITVEYYLTRLSGTIRMLEKLDIINRTSELARLFGLQWWEVLSRGSQFRVESLMLRAARPLNLIALSPTVSQRAAMRAPECLPLIFEPESRYYCDPVIVLDFQSLYPSMMIAYNYCFSTCIGRLQNINGDSAYEFGAWRLKIPKTKLETLAKRDLIHWSPVGVGFVKPSVRRGVLPALLRRILAARQAVKKGMKLQTDETVKKAMHSRQLGLKLIANVTYGYTAANFSGRMPCVEVGDSVVAKGRETLERAVKMVKDNKQWNAKVVYGDTDSMFVLVAGCTRQQAFEVGRQIAAAVTADNPAPVALKLEKVYQPCILQTKKRYVGYMYESPDQEKPIYEAKGIETVRRDGCPAGVKLLRDSLCELFAHGDVSAVKRLVTSRLARLARGAAPAHELLFTREFRGLPAHGAPAPPALIARRLVSKDKRALPRTGERVAWLVCAGAPGLPLGKLARSPDEVRRLSLTPHVAYYAARVLLPPLHRCLSLLGADVFKWWSELGRARGGGGGGGGGGAGGIARYMWRSRCAVCSDTVSGTGKALCGTCAVRPCAHATVLARLATAKDHLTFCDMLCDSCAGHTQSARCENTECPVLWRRDTAQQQLAEITDIVSNLPPALLREGMDF